MWLFGLFLFFGFLAVIICIAAFCRFRDLGFWRFTWKNLKWVSLAVLIVWLAISIMCRHHLYSATQCYFRGVSMKSTTKYSLYLGECQIQTPRGSYVPIDRTRALPNGHEGSEIDDGNDDTYFGDQ
ncbi:hypothetical protein RCS94_04120 [Orbaceae bacterium ac157xtp]